MGLELRGRLRTQDMFHKHPFLVKGEGISLKGHTFLAPYLGWVCRDKI